MDERLDAGILAEVQVYELPALLLRQVRLTRYSRRTKSVDDAEVEDFGDATMMCSYILYAIHRASRRVVNILTIPKRS